MKNHKRVLSICVWFLVFLASALLFGYYVPLPEPKEPVASRVYDFERRLKDAGKADTFIVGACYAVRIPPPPGTCNLGISSVSPQEIEQVLYYHVPRDAKVYYILTLRDIAMRKDPVRRYFSHPVARRIFLAKTWVLEMCGANIQYTQGIMYRSTKAEVTVVKGAIAGTTSPDLIWTELVKDVKKFRATDREIDAAIESYKKLASRYPHMNFILHPTIPLQLVPETSAFALKLNAFIATNERFRQQMRNSGLPVRDYSDRYSSESFRDFLHLKDYTTFVANIPDMFS